MSPLRNFIQRICHACKNALAQFYHLPVVHPVLSVTTQTIRGFFQADGMIMAAAIAFFAILSLIPFLLLMFSVAGFLLQTFGDRFADPQSMFAHLETYIQAVVPFMGTDVMDQIRNLAVHRQVFGVTGLVSLFITAGLVFRTMEVSFSRIFRTRPRPVFVTQALFAVLAMAFVMLFLGIHMLGLIGGSMISANDTSAGREFATFLKSHGLLRHGVTLFSAAIVFFILQKAFNREKVGLGKLAAGAGLFSLLWMVAAKAFGYYTRHIAQFSFLYGSLATLAIVVAWIFYAAAVLLLCSQFVHVLHQRKQNPESPARGDGPAKKDPSQRAESPQ